MLCQSQSWSFASAKSDWLCCLAQCCSHFPCMMVSQHGRQQFKLIWNCRHRTWSLWVHRLLCTITYHYIIDRCFNFPTVLQFWDPNPAPACNFDGPPDEAPFRLAAEWHELACRQCRLYFGTCSSPAWQTKMGMDWWIQILHFSHLLPSTGGNICGRLPVVDSRFQEMGGNPNHPSQR